MVGEAVFASVSAAKGHRGRKRVEKLAVPLVSALDDGPVLPVRGETVTVAALELFDPRIVRTVKGDLLKSSVAANHRALKVVVVLADGGERRVLLQLQR